MKPVYLFADSQLLFWQTGGKPFISRLLDHVIGLPNAAYIGASNGDRAEFYGIFCAAMDAVGVRHKLMVRSEPTEEEIRFLEEADIILLAGGDPVRGWHVLEENGVKDIVARRYRGGAVLCGVSAGAVQLGAGICSEGAGLPLGMVPTYNFVPRIIDVHDEGRWKEMNRALRRLGTGAKGIGIPLGGGMVFDPESDSVEPIRRPLCEIEISGETFRERLLLPLGTNLC